MLLKHPWLRRHARLVNLVLLRHARVLEGLSWWLHAWLWLIASCIGQVHVVHALLLLEVLRLVLLGQLAHLPLLLRHPLQRHLHQTVSGPHCS